MKRAGGIGFALWWREGLWAGPGSSLIEREARDAIGFAGPQAARAKGSGAGSRPGTGRQTHPARRSVLRARPRAPGHAAGLHSCPHARYGASSRSPRGVSGPWCGRGWEEEGGAMPDHGCRPRLPLRLPGAGEACETSCPGSTAAPATDASGASLRSGCERYSQAWQHCQEQRANMILSSLAVRQDREGNPWRGTGGRISFPGSSSRRD